MRRNAYYRRWLLTASWLLVIGLVLGMSGLFARNIIVILLGGFVTIISIAMFVIIISKSLRDIEVR